MPKFKKASADEARAKRQGHTKDVAGGTAIMKGFKSPPSWDPTERSARFVMTSESVDRYKDIVVQSGMDIENFQRNPQGLLFHNSRSWPIGNWSDVTKVLSGRPKRTEGKLNFLPEGTDEDADRAARHVAAGSIKTVSIGFKPDWDEIEFILDDDEDWTGGFRYNKSELLECSLVPIPAQPDALVKDVGGDMVLAKDLIEDILDNYAKSPEGILLPMDEYRAKYMDMFGGRSTFVVDKAFAPATKNFAAKGDMVLKASTDEEASAFVGAKVAFDPAHVENKGYPFDNLAKAEGEIIASYIVADGANKGVHGLWVEYLEDNYSGMFRGIKAERFLLVKSASEGEPAVDGDASSDLKKDALKFAEQIRSGDEIESSSYRFSIIRADKVVSRFKFPITGTHEEFADIEKLFVGACSKQQIDDASIKITIDTTEAHENVKALTDAVDKTEKRVEGLFEKMRKFLAGGTEDKTIRIEPKLDDDVDPQDVVRDPPTQDEIAAAKERAANVRQRLAAKGMIAA
jgi:HK97 family phage prohead protease